MKIIILVRILWTAGAQKIAIKEARELSLMGHDVELVFLRGKMLPEYENLLSQIKYTILSETGKSWLSPIYDYITRKFVPDRGSESRVDYNLIRNFPHYLKDKNIDYIICHDQLAGLAAYYAFKKYGIRYSVFVHERVSLSTLPLLGKIWYRYEHMVLSSATAVFSITDKVGNSVKNLHTVNTTTNYPGMDINTVTPFDQKENAIIAVSYWDYGRKPEIYLDVIKNIPNFILYFVGNFRIGELEQKFYEEIKERDLGERVIVKNGLKESDLIDLYQKSKFYVRFGFGEFGLGSAMEPIQNCVPLIVNKDLGASGLVEKYSCGLVIDKIDTLEIGEFINKYNVITLYEELQNNILKLSKDYSWRKHCELLLNPLYSMSV